MKRIGLGIIVMAGCISALQAQTPDDRKAMTPAPLREADVVYAKHVRRIIDIREKKNMVMNWPGNPFNQLLLNLATVGPDKNGFGEVMMYSSDSLNKPMNLHDFTEQTKICDVVFIQDTLSDNPYEGHDSVICHPYEGYKIVRFQIDEEWIFDKQRGMFFPRIVSIAPLFQQSIGGVDLPERPMFYVKYNDLRPYLVKQKVFNRQNDATGQTYFDFFEQRMFSSYVTMESNMYNYAIKDMPEFKDDPMEALYEGQRIQQDLIDKEQDFWEQ